MFPNGFFFRQKADPFPLANCHIEISQITEQQSKRLFDVEFAFVSLNDTTGEQRVVQMSLTANNECKNRPRFSAMALDDGFVVRDTPRFNHACTLFC